VPVVDLCKRVEGTKSEKGLLKTEQVKGGSIRKHEERLVNPRWTMFVWFRRKSHIFKQPSALQPNWGQQGEGRSENTKRIRKESQMDFLGARLERGRVRGLYDGRERKTSVSKGVVLAMRGQHGGRLERTSFLLWGRAAEKQGHLAQKHLQLRRRARSPRDEGREGERREESSPGRRG